MSTTEIYSIEKTGTLFHTDQLKTVGWAECTFGSHWMKNMILAEI
ncbi:MAG: hypothetical protein ACFWTV_12260 [Enterococcus faecium]|jgi:hypothetical protein